MIPTYIAQVGCGASFPIDNVEIIRSLRHYVAENIRTARRFLKSVDKSIDIDSLTIDELNEHTPEASVPAMLAYAEQGEDIGMVSEAGCPGVADPGALLACEAHSRGIKVIPLVGPSSLLMALMASGLNGQNFAFKGYLPVGGDVNKTLKSMEERSARENQTQLFIETPYRNDKMMQTLLKTLRKDTRLCVARDVMGPEELIETHRVSTWLKRQLPELNKRPTVFLFLA